MARQMLKEADLGRVAGGVAIDNYWGDYSVYKIGPNDGPFTHTFEADRLDEVCDIADQVYDPSLEASVNDANIMEALIAVEGLLTPIG